MKIFDLEPFLKGIVYIYSLNDDGYRLDIPQDQIPKDWLDKDIQSIKGVDLNEESLEIYVK